MKILIAEDDLVNRTFLNKFLSQYGDCDLVVDGLETIDTFLQALKSNEPYQLVCLDIMMPKVDGVKTLKVIRDLEKQYGIPAQERVKIIMTTALAEAQLVHTAFEYGCEAYAAKPIDLKKLIDVLGKLGLIAEADISVKSVPKPAPGKSSARDVLVKKQTPPKNSVDNTQCRKKENNAEKRKNTSKRGMQNEGSLYKMTANGDPCDIDYFISVRALPSYQLEVCMKTGTTIHFDFRSRLNTSRFGMLRDEELFQSVGTDGEYLIFNSVGMMQVKITASEFMDLVLIDRTK